LFCILTVTGFLLSFDTGLPLGFRLPCNVLSARLNKDTRPYTEQFKAIKVCVCLLQPTFSTQAGSRSRSVAVRTAAGLLRHAYRTP
jgi:hypothetical protein